jgi:cyclophilin family peptidyl-prolyl cis-trans isomerase
MNRLSLLLFALVPAFALTATAQNASPIVTNGIGNQTLFSGAAARSIDLTEFFQDQDFSRVVRLTTVEGVMDFALYERQKPITVANFLRYVSEGRYFATDPTTQQLASSFVHRLVPDFVLQGGGFIATVNPNGSGNLQPTQVATLPMIQNEFGISNKRATIAMAKLGGNPNSATSQWFVNLKDNAGTPPNGLDFQNGGFTVFGRVIGSGMDVADRIAGLPRRNAGSPFDSLPVRNLNATDPVKVPNVVSIPGIAEIAPVPSPLTFSAFSTNPGRVEVRVSDQKLLLTGTASGPATITVTATDLDGASVTSTFSVNVIAAPARLANISTRLEVREGAEVLIGGFIMRGDSPKRVLVRAVGPSLGSQGISNPLADPRLELYDSANVIGVNDNWGDGTKQDIIDTGLNPSNAREAAVLVTLPSSSAGVGYTVIVQGADSTPGIGLVEIYDLDSGPGSDLENIATRGRVDSNEKVMIGGFIISGTVPKNILVRASGPSLSAQGVAGAMNDPRLDLVDVNGNTLGANDDWEANPQASDIQASGLAPSNPRESVLLQSLNPGAYTAIVSAADGSPGVGLVEIFQRP